MKKKNKNKNKNKNKIEKNNKHEKKFKIALSVLIRTPRALTSFNGPILLDQHASVWW